MAFQVDKSPFTHQSSLHHLLYIEALRMLRAFRTSQPPGSWVNPASTSKIPTPAGLTLARAGFVEATSTLPYCFRLKPLGLSFLIDHEGENPLTDEEADWLEDNPPPSWEGEENSLPASVGESRVTVINPQSPLITRRTIRGDIRRVANRVMKNQRAESLSWSRNGDGSLREDALKVTIKPAPGGVSFHFSSERKPFIRECSTQSEAYAFLYQTLQI